MAQLVKSEGGEWWCEGMIIEDLSVWLAELPPETTLIVHLPGDDEDEDLAA